VYVYAHVCIRVFCVCLCLYLLHGICAWVFLSGPLTKMICLFCMRLCEYSCVLWSGFGSPDLSGQSLSTFHRSFILVLVLAQNFHSVTQLEVYLPACGRRHRNLTLWRWFKEKLSVSVTLGFGVSLVYFHTCSPYDSLGDLCALHPSFSLLLVWYGRSWRGLPWRRHWDANVTGRNRGVCESINLNCRRPFTPILR